MCSHGVRTNALSSMEAKIAPPPPYSALLSLADAAGEHFRPVSRTKNSAGRVRSSCDRNSFSPAPCPRLPSP